MQKNKICPIMSRPNGEFFKWVHCQKEKCQFWMEERFNISEGDVIDTSHCKFIG